MSSVCPPRIILLLTLPTAPTAAGRWYSERPGGGTTPVASFWAVPASSANVSVEGRATSMAATPGPHERHARQRRPSPVPSRPSTMTQMRTSSPSFGVFRQMGYFVQREELLREVLNELGFRRRGKQIDRRITRAIRAVGHDADDSRAPKGGNVQKIDSPASVSPAPEV